MRIAGIYPFEPINDAKIQSIYGEPIGLELVLANAGKAGHEVELFVPVKEGKEGLECKSHEELVKEINVFNPDVAAFSLYTCHFDKGKEIACKLKENNPDIKIVAGNRHPTTNFSEIDYPFDFYVIGEGEQTFVQLLHEMENGKNYDKVNGITFKENGKTVVTKPHKFLECLDSIPDALRHPILLKQTYNGLVFPPASKKPKTAIVEYSRGCHGFCKFCDNASVWKRRVRFKSAEKVVAEMSTLKKNGIDVFYFMDLNFTSDKGKVVEFCDTIEAKGEKFNWYCMSNIDTAKPRILKRMKEVGCFKVNYGVESTSDESLKRMNKGLRREDILKSSQCHNVLKASQRAGLMAGGYYIIGFPWETEKSILEDAKRLKFYPIHYLNIGIATPHPGTAWRKEFKECDLINCWQHYDRKHLCYRHKSLDEKTLQSIQKNVYQRFFKSREYLENVKELVSIEPKFRQSFNDYFKILGICLSV